VDAVVKAPKARFSVAGKEIGDGAPAYLVAEMACAHQGDPKLALEMIDHAAQAGVDAVQIQLFTTEDLVSPKHPGVAMIKGLTLDRGCWEAVVARAKDLGLPVWINVFDTNSLSFAVRSGAAALKLHSTDLSTPEMLDAAAQSGLPVVVAVGASTMAEIDWAFERMAKHGSLPSLLYHGYQGYPTDLADSHLRYIQTLKSAFEVPIGFQDHVGRDDPFSEILPLMALAAGAASIEKHFTYAAGLHNIDHHSSMDPATFARFVQTFRKAALALGSAEERPLSEGEIRYRKVMKKSVVAMRDLPQGHVLSRGDVAFLRAEHPGATPSEFDGLVGLKTALAIERGETITAAKLS
jgi:sialic acid synthase SpsE